MPVRESYVEGTPSWIDLSTKDPAGAKAFYGALFGWEFQANPVPDGGEYIMATLGGRSAAGMMQQSHEQAQMGLPSAWNTYITVDDVEATVGNVEAAGGSVMMAPMEVMDAGHMAIIADPCGAVVCLWQANQHIGAEVVNEAGALCWNELMCSDLAAAKPFYKEVLGLDAVDQEMPNGMTYTLLMLGEDMVGGAMPPPMEDIPNHWTVYFAVDDIDAAITEATELGGAVQSPVIDTPAGKIGVISDPQGAVFHVIQMVQMDAA